MSTWDEPAYVRRQPGSRYEARCHRHGMVVTQPLDSAVSDFSQYKGPASCRALYAGLGNDNQCGLPLDIQLIVVPRDA